MTDSKLQPVLEDGLVILRPLKSEDYDSLYKAASDPLTWEQHTDDRYKEDVFKKFFEDSLESGGALVIIDKKSGEIIGTSRFNPIEKSESAVEIGWTFIARQFWGGRYNQAVKTLMINHALQFYDDIIFYVDKENFRSQKAVQKVGGVRLAADSYYSKIRRDERDFVFRITKKEWENRDSK